MEPFEVGSAAQYSALGHPLRLRLLLALGAKPATISQLAAELGTRKGNVAHHLGVLREAGLVVLGGTRQVRGGTEQYYERVAEKLRLGGEDDARRELTVRLLSEEIRQAEPDPFLVLRRVRLTREQARRLTATLGELVEGLEPAADEEPRFSVLVGVLGPRE
ncbi:helix-turn-helix domain-containing protein [Luedemannella helvata]|uniref:HTH arsR-type domain-containing protein n=1 Tax=Luedemannella helvata TaxID=349315 RepID=A0ABP4VT31_9ACTN